MGTDLVRDGLSRTILQVLKIVLFLKTKTKILLFCQLANFLSYYYILFTLILYFLDMRIEVVSRFYNILCIFLFISFEMCTYMVWGSQLLKHSLALIT